MSDTFIKIKLPEFRVGFESVWKATNYGTETDPEKARYSLTMIFDKGSDLSELKKNIKKIMDQECLKKLRWPIIKNGNDLFDERGDSYSVYKNCFYVTARSRNKPTIVDKNIELITDTSEFYSGCYARAAAVLAYWSNANGKGISLRLLSAQKTRDGEPLKLGGYSLENAKSDYEVISDDSNEEEDMLL